MVPDFRFSRENKEKTQNTRSLFRSHSGLVASHHVHTLAYGSTFRRRGTEARTYVSVRFHVPFAWNVAEAWNRLQMNGIRRAMNGIAREEAAWYTDVWFGDRPRPPPETPS